MSWLTAACPSKLHSHRVPQVRNPAATSPWIGCCLPSPPCSLGMWSTRVKSSFAAPGLAGSIPAVVPVGHRTGLAGSVVWWQTHVFLSLTSLQKLEVMFDHCVYGSASDNSLSSLIIVLYICGVVLLGFLLFFLIAFSNHFFETLDFVPSACRHSMFCKALPGGHTVKVCTFLWSLMT